MRELRPQKLAMEHSRQKEVVGELRLSRDLRRRVDLGIGASDDAGARCACLDSFAPTVASVGSTITMFSTCSLDAATEVRICGIKATIVAQTEDKIEATVPAGAAGACSVQLISPGGVFTAAGTLTVS